MDNYAERYARVIIQTGVNLYPGQCLNVTTGYHNYEFAVVIAEQAYKAGARYVHIDVVSNTERKTRLTHSKESYLDFVPDFLSSRYNEMCADDWAFVRIDDTEELSVLEGADPEKLGNLETALRKSKTVFYKNLLKDKICWCVVCAPGPKWAHYLTGNESVDNLWELLAPILRLDHDDAVQAWTDHGLKLLERRRILDEMQIDTLHFKNSDTDLKIGLTSTSCWHGGPSYTLDRRLFIANIPTEEVFTTPDYTRTEGRVKVTRPLKVLETMVVGASFVFKDGKVVEFSADKNEAVLAKYLSIDEGASFVGEVALVGCDSPLYTSGKVFGSILYDENAASHIALGSGYPSCLSNMNSLHGDEDLRKAGCNVSLVHTDFMIGSETMDVIALCRDKSEKTIMKDGLFVID
ncbi:MAG: aminopeptidase [Spirochaetes bacterium]|jgi:aminopeptidase|nr:aminopeptidase [Spirochaetota bacterium]